MERLIELTTVSKVRDCDFSAITTMLRQQAKKIEDLLDHNVKLIDDLFSERKEVIRLETEIEALKKELALQKLSDIGQEIENEPVAWMLLGLEDRKPKLINPQVIDHLEGTWIPLYTHPNEDRDSAIYATGYWKGIEYKKQHDELQTLVKSFFEDFLDYQEESDSGRVFNPIHISCTRAMMIEPLAKLLIRMRKLSGVSDGA
jgi:hypothetical protein